MHRCDRSKTCSATPKLDLLGFLPLNRKMCTAWRCALFQGKEKRGVLHLKLKTCGVKDRILSEPVSYGSDEDATSASKFK